MQLFIFDLPFIHVSIYLDYYIFIEGEVYYCEWGMILHLERLAQ